MNKKAVLAGLGSGVIAGVLLAFVALNIAAPVANDQLGGTIGVKLVVQVHRADGTTETYVKEGDLILKNFAHLIDLLLMGNTREQDGEEKLTDITGNVNDGYITAAGYNKDGLYGYIHIGSGTTAPTLNDYKLENEIVSFVVQDVDINVNGTDMVIDVFGSYTADTAINVSEIGLSVKMRINTGSSALIHEIMLFRDVLANPIQLSDGDGITVHYYITLDNP